ncbi:hypothetical protein BLS_007500 [Venturia inaequalis]|uniref:Uncharacterized protein n=1 Tax=Venturia inaequalis TaxID=5025 RepID=A0A8H3UF68_VENIN|nr:hypothetical protein BLS_007500 [Venturia inaequalis]KAE9968133.1 hypothetical protein EG328_007773 [Venturia inaequalis]RDI87536.1 hypothetical protein Vi05172_g2568 [Venturia inaequalis]
MSTAVASAVTASLGPPSMDHSRPYATIAPTGSTISSATPTRRSNGTNSRSPPSMHDSAALRRLSSEGKRSPNTGSLHRASHLPKVLVKQEPGSPPLPTPRHRPSRLNLASSNMGNGGPASARPSAPLTSRDSAGLAVHDIGLACLSPGFNTVDPSMREQLERSMNVREQQRKIIEARQKGGNPADLDALRTTEGSAFKLTAKTPGTGRRKGPPPGLSIAPPSHESFANERVIQSAPLHGGFPRGQMPLTRQIINQPSNLSHTSHIHHIPANQTNNRLPPISDVFPGELNAGPLPTRPSSHFQSPGRSSQSAAHHQPLPSPSYPNPPHTAYPHPRSTSTRRREFTSAEEAVKEMTGGREDMMPRMVHYGGQQPPTPPSPRNIGLGVSAPAELLPLRTGSSRRRDRDEYERDHGSPPLGRGPQAQQARKGPFGEGRDSPASIASKKEEFLKVVSRAWDLWHE